MTVSKEVKKALRDWAREKLAEGSTHDFDALTEQGDKYFRKQEAFVEDLIDTAIPYLVRGMLHEVFASGRRNPITAEGETVNVAELLEKPAWPFAAWTEHVGHQYHVKLENLKGVDLDYAATAREKKGHDELNKAEFLRTLRKRVGDEDEVRDKWTREEIGAAYLKIFGPRKG